MMHILKRVAGRYVPRGLGLIVLLVCVCLPLTSLGPAGATAPVVSCPERDDGVAAYAPALWQASCAVWQETIDRQTAVIVPSRAYAPQVWTRDAFWTALA